MGDVKRGPVRELEAVDGSGDSLCLSNSTTLAQHRRHHVMNSSSVHPSDHMSQSEPTSPGVEDSGDR
ncbi:hypothetical protein GGTG_14416 [Gaeumannomyces tritici R3-111a-1]|uniref:Uncharacterized protein n=1 Tax=Gaeumannomyces tritici (strain R3-111a-1) TaxID=644352 RepID=J3PLE8_GAET3|nr:hypothetical protein GGTG_14416 [Gaeumannomyces tritici R3-111a-1]EJT68007.1 hypothetical protein GGTG_14416 [Gaeumannomyces tritici R3-111a-1]